MSYPRPWPFTLTWLFGALALADLRAPLVDALFGAVIWGGACWLASEVHAAIRSGS